MKIEIEKLKEIAKKYEMFLYEERARITLLARSNIFDSTVWSCILDGKGHLNSICYFEKLNSTFVELRNKENYLCKGVEKYYFTSKLEVSDFEIIELKSNIIDEDSLCTYLQDVKDSIKKAEYFLKKETIEIKKKLIENDFERN